MEDPNKQELLEKLVKQQIIGSWVMWGVVLLLSVLILIALAIGVSQGGG
jgi:predicted ABC-type exoprotein transport system permease subunit